MKSRNVVMIASSFWRFPMPPKPARPILGGMSSDLPRWSRSHWNQRWPCHRDRSAVFKSRSSKFAGMSASRAPPCALTRRESTRQTLTADESYCAGARTCQRRPRTNAAGQSGYPVHGPEHYHARCRSTVTITERRAAGGIQRTIQQFIGYIWFNIQSVTGTTTTLQTPTAVAAIRGTEGTEEVPNPNQSTHSLNEGVEQVTEVVTQQSVHNSQRAADNSHPRRRFRTILGLAALIPKPGVGAGRWWRSGRRRSRRWSRRRGWSGRGHNCSRRHCRRGCDRPVTVVSVVAASVSAGALVTAAVIPAVTHKKEKPTPAMVL